MRRHGAEATALLPTNPKAYLGPVFMRSIVLKHRLPLAVVSHAATAGTSPWQEIASRADALFGDDSGLSPWWTLPGAEIQRHLFALPQSRDVHRFDRLCRQRSLYRLALGHPRQQELIELLGARDPKVIEELATLTLDLSAYGAEQDRVLAAE